MTTTRDRLQYIFGNTWRNDVEFKEKWAEFAARTDHTVKMIAPPLSDEHRWLMPHMNCFAYSLGLERIPAYHRWIRTHHALDLLDGEFMGDLIEQKWLKELTGVDVPVNSLVMYYNGSLVTHCGFIFTSDKRVRSKFNVHEFYEHGLLEVQTSFGSPERYFELPTSDLQHRIISELDAAARE